MRAVLAAVMFTETSIISPWPPILTRTGEGSGLGNLTGSEGLFFGSFFTECLQNAADCLRVRFDVVQQNSVGGVDLYIEFRRRVFVRCLTTWALLWRLSATRGPRMLTSLARTFPQYHPSKEG